MTRMMISARGRYALRMMVDVARYQGDGHVALKDIAARQQISQKYLEQIIPALNSAGFLTAVRGQQGGYRLTRSPGEYSLGEILRAAEGELSSVTCLDSHREPCARQADCDALPVWRELNRIIADYLDSVTLQNVLDQQIPETTIMTQE